MKITTIEQAEKEFGPFTNNQYVDILNYFMTGTVPLPDGCTSCDRAYVRTVIGKIIQHNADVEEELYWDRVDAQDFYEMQRENDEDE